MGRSNHSQHSGAAYAALEPRVRHISANKIKKKWKHLPPASQSSVRELLISLEQQAKQNHNTRQSNKSLEAEHCVKQIMEKLIERLPRMPFPPSAIEESFDFEINLHRIRTIEEQLASNTHAMNLLNSQIRYEKQLLEEDEREVTDLAESLRSNDVHRSQRLKSLHRLARDMKSAEEPNHSSLLQYSRNEAVNLDWSLLETDSALQPHLAELRNHLTSMGNNKQSMDNVIGALHSARTPLLRVEIYQATCS